ncbi:MAG: hypothetical protein IK078_01330, partial [Lachnospiraceae bacterium]|nr:hypothetical protein [Lachnospiraceae bacterium]
MLSESKDDEQVMTAGQALSTAARKGTVATDQDQPGEEQRGEDGEKQETEKKSGEDGPQVMAVSKAVTTEKNIRDEASLYEGIDDSQVI